LGPDVVAAGVGPAREQAASVAAGESGGAIGALQHAAPVLLTVLVWAVVAEFLALRTFLRLGSVLPDREALLPLYRAVEVGGLAAMNLAALTAAALTALLTVLVLAPGGPQVAPRAAAPAPFGRQLLGPGLVVAALAVAVYAGVAQAFGARTHELPGASSAYLAAEALAVGAALALPWCYRPAWRKRHLAVGGAVGLVLAMALLTRPWVVATIAMWTVGFSLFLPGALYAAALASAAATTWALLDGDSSSRMSGCGLLLVGLAGLKLDFTYTALLALAGVVVLMTGAIRARPAPTAAA
jgi:hypothetical protein